MTLIRPDTPRPSTFPGIALVAPGSAPIPGPRARLPLHPGDRALIASGEPIVVGQPVIAQAHATELLEVPYRGDVTEPRPGMELDLAQLQIPRGVGKPQPRPGDRGYLLYVGADHVARVALARTPMLVASPVDGVVESVTPGAITIRASGVGIAGPVGWGQPVAGRVLMGVMTPDEEMRAGAVDISAAGSILVAGARLDIEALTRARAIGVAGIICGGVVGRELQQLEESDARQRASLHVLMPFAILALDGYGRRPLPTLAWELLAAAAAEERVVGVLPDARLAVVDGDPSTLSLGGWPGDSVRLAAGEGAGRTGRLVGLAGPTRRPGGVYQPAGHVELGPTTDGPASRRVVPLADLERLVPDLDA